MASDKCYWPQAEHRSRAAFIAQQTVYIRGQFGAVPFLNLATLFAGNSVEVVFADCSCG